MKIHYLQPPDGHDWLLPEEVADRFRSAFAYVEVSAEAARKEGAELISKYKSLMEAGLGDSRSTTIDEFEAKWVGALSIVVALDDDGGLRFRTIACVNDRMRLDFAPNVPGRRHKGFANRAARSLGYEVHSIDGD